VSTGPGPDGAVLVARDLSVGHGDRTLFSGLNLTIGPGDVVGLVGANGAGKSTLLRVLAGELVPDKGSVTLSPRSAQVGHLAQEPDLRPGETVRGWLRRRTGVAAATDRMEATASAMAGDDSAAVAQSYSDALEQWLAIGGADLDDRVPPVAAELGLSVDLDLPVQALSGGQSARVGLAALLLSRHDLYLLDEPTNDLDIDGLDRLEDYVSDRRAALVVVSHDREFLSRTVTTVVELDRSLQRAAVYGGSFDAYLDERSTARRHARRAYDEYAGRASELAARARRQRAWMDKGVRNARRKARDNDKSGRKFRAESTEKQAAKARQTDRMIERLEPVPEPRKEWALQFTIAESARSGDVVATARGAVVRRGTFTLGPVDLQLDRTDRVAVTGPNGGGKSTLLAALLGQLPLAAGSAQLGSGTVVGEIDQARRQLLAAHPLGRAFEQEMPAWPSADVRTLLAKFGLGAQHVGRPAAALSPGERTRAALALLQARGVNLLVLDEPTNHLDLPAIEQLEDALEEFGGTFLLVTHDRRMLETVRLTRRWDVAAGTVTEIAPD
jgi:ATPase subunit of ABC transporter with duplicated ATPase domains